MARMLWAGLDIGGDTTSVCVIDDAGQVLQSGSCSSTVRDIHNEVRWLRRRRLARLGVEATGATSLVRGLRNLGYSIDVYETRQLSKFLRARRNKTDAGDANGIAEAGRIGASVVPKVYLKSLEGEVLQCRLTMRRHLIRERVAAVNLLCRQLERFGGRVRRAGTPGHLRSVVEAEMGKIFKRRVDPLTVELRQLLTRCEDMMQWQRRLDEQLMCLAQDNELCRRFMTIPGVGPICALTFLAAVDEPHRFEPSSKIASYLGLAPRFHESGLRVRRPGRISKMGNTAARTALVRAAMIYMSTSADSELLTWVSAVEERRGRGRARTALARKLSIVMLTMWKNGTVYEPHRTASEGSGSQIGPRSSQ